MINKTIVNSVSIKWSEQGIIKSKKFKTQIELDIFRKELEIKNNFVSIKEFKSQAELNLYQSLKKSTDFKIIGIDRDVTYSKGYDCYAKC